jgi:hypothetical protein
MLLRATRGRNIGEFCTECAVPMGFERRMSEPFTGDPYRRGWREPFADP